jgi:hypothetical protein
LAEDGRRTTSPGKPAGRDAEGSPDHDAQRPQESDAVKVALRTGDPVPDRRAFGNPWASDKEGKRLLALPKPRDMRK